MPARPSELITSYPRPLEAIVLKALAKDKSHRFASARELFEALALALPQAFQAGFESHVAHYLDELIGTLGAETKTRLRVARRALDEVHKGSPTAPGATDPASFTSLRALVVDAGAPATLASTTETHRTPLSSSSSELQPSTPARHGTRAALLPIAITAVVVGAIVAFIGPRWSKWNDRSSAVPPMQELAPATAHPPSIARVPVAPLPSASAPAARASADTTPATVSPRRAPASSRRSDSTPRARRTPERAKTSAVAPSPPAADLGTPPSAPPSSIRDPLQKRL
jgi:hypothetical protein